MGTHAFHATALGDVKLQSEKGMSSAASVLLARSFEAAIVRSVIDVQQGGMKTRPEAFAQCAQQTGTPRKEKTRARTAQMDR